MLTSDLFVLANANVLLSGSVVLVQLSVAVQVTDWKD